MHNLNKIKVFRILLRITYLPSLLFICPLALLKKKNPSHLFFFFDRYAIGGAQRVHIDILESVHDIFKKVYFTRRSLNDKMKEEFYSIPGTGSSDIHIWCDNLLFRLFSVHYYCFYINRHSRVHVFSSNSTFFYDMLPFLNKKFHKTELLHNFTVGKRGMEFFGLANYKYLDTRTVVDAGTQINIKDQYAAYNIPDVYFNRVLLIEPGVDIPTPPVRNFSSPLKILYAGRGGPQKRIHLINRIAEKCFNEGLDVEFHFAGPMADELSNFTKEHSSIHGEISSKEDMYNIYRSVNILLLTSAYEGFPMVIKEAMACGTVPVTTALPGIITHLIDNKNSLLIRAIENEDDVVEQGIAKIKQLLNDNNLLRQLSEQAYQYASKNFDKSKFTSEYRALLLNNNI